MKQLINILVASLFLSACATTEITPIASIQSINGGFNVPYRVSDAGHFLVDVSINESERRPFILDTGANVSVIYEPTATEMDLLVEGGVVAVNGLVGSGLRPILDLSLIHI